MNPTAERNGQIITFYSFKGGVGRTMTLANVAFLSALNGLRVLVMDWDLEAPGLAYYFRGLQDAVDARALKEQPGVLDMLWDWSDSAGKVESDKDFDALLTRFKSGAVFDRCVQQLHGDYRGGVLDFIGAGSKHLETCDLPYEDALAQFSWPVFFEKHVGGVMLQELRRWAKGKYDVVFLDSRTGLADVAGVCTMQLPDKVGLCFVLNRQNIDGVARVAGAIRRKREEHVGVRAIPMRVTASDSSEASDAQAKAISELTHVGGFSRDAARDDLRLLSVSASSSIPYYETLAPFLTDDPSKDPLTQNYATVASHILGREIDVVSLDRGLVELARSRLQPRLATIEYVTKLRSSEPSRMIDELQRLIEGALDAALDGNELDNEYVQALVDSIAAADATDPIQTEEIFPPAIELVRTLMAANPTWRPALIALLDRYVEGNLYLLDDDEGLALLGELDGLLAIEPTIEAAIKRISYRRLALPILQGSDGCERVLQTSAEIREMIASVRQKSESVGQALAADQLDALISAEISSRLQSGIALDRRGSPEQALEELQAGNGLMSAVDRTKARTNTLRMGSQIHSYLATFHASLIDGTRAAQHAIEAMRWAPSANLRAGRFRTLAEVVLKSQDPSLTIDFCEATFAEQDLRGNIALGNLHARTGGDAGHFLGIVERILDILSRDKGARVNAVLSTLLSVSMEVLTGLKRRARHTQIEELDELQERVGVIQRRVESHAAAESAPAASRHHGHAAPKGDA